MMSVHAALKTFIKIQWVFLDMLKSSVSQKNQSYTIIYDINNVLLVFQIPEKTCICQAWFNITD